MEQKKSHVFAAPVVLEKIEWYGLCQVISQSCQIKTAADNICNLVPNLSVDKIKHRWDRLTSLKELFSDSLSLPLQDIPPVKDILQSCVLSRPLQGKEFLVVRDLLESVEWVCDFCKENSEQYKFLIQIYSQFRRLPQVLLDLNRSFDDEGSLKDDASPALSSLREEIKTTTSEIESSLKELINKNSSYRQYLQGDYFTVRNERYVVPVRLDARGRVAGTIVGLSSSSQTLLLEPRSIKSLNDRLEHIKLSEKIEVIKIIASLSKVISAVRTEIAFNYNLLIELDELSAMAIFAEKTKSNCIEIVSHPALELKEIRHPLLVSAGVNVVSNSVVLENSQNILVISGPNAGGKTVVLKSIALLQTMARCGLLLPCHVDSKIFLFDKIFFEIGDDQNISSGLSSFAAQVAGMKNVLDKATSRDLILLDEIATATEPVTGSALAQAFLEEVSEKKAKTVVTTHFDNIKVMALKQDDFRNASMEFDKRDQNPSFRLLLDLPGKSYAIEAAKRFGLSATLLARTEKIKGSGAVDLDQALDSLQKTNEKLKVLRNKHEDELLKVTKKNNELNLKISELDSAKKKVISNIKDEYRKKFEKLNVKMLEQIKEHRDSLDKAPSKSSLKKTAREYSSQLHQLENSLEPQKDIKGKKIDFFQLQADDSVYVINLQTKGKVVSLNPDNKSIEVKVGGINFRTKIENLTLLDSKKSSLKKVSLKSSITKGISLPYKTSSNTLDIRGLTLEVALEKLWSYLDAAILRGDEVIYIKHGHGTNILKDNIRLALEKDCPYNVIFEDGKSRLNDDTITIVKLL
jgi:DNA mismatch repair protein MutS2